jgi:hypothetical protein
MKSKKQHNRQLPLAQKYEDQIDREEMRRREAIIAGECLAASNAEAEIEPKIPPSISEMVQSDAEAQIPLPVSQTAPIDLEKLCVHEAGHAVMGYLNGWPSPRLTANLTEGGLAWWPPFEAPVREHIEVNLAGYAREAGILYQYFDSQTSTGCDLDKTRALLERYPHTRVWIVEDQPVTFSVEDALNRHFQNTGDRLWPFFVEINELGELLAVTGEMSPRRVAAFMRQRIKPVMEELRNG